MPRASFPVDGITVKMKEQLRTRKKAFRGQTPAQVWEQIYRLLFPGGEVPNPYFEPVRDLQEGGNYSQDYDDLTRYQEYILRELAHFFEEVVQNAMASNDLALQENTRIQMISLLPEAINRATSAFRCTLGQIDPGQGWIDSSLDLSTLQITQQNVPQVGRPTLSSDSGYSSNRPAPLHSPRRAVNLFSETNERPSVLDGGVTSSIEERTTSDSVDIARHSQAAGDNTQDIGSAVPPLDDVNLMSGIEDFLTDSLSFPPGPWPVNPEYVSLDSEDVLYGRL
ncbi:hypothetical protein V8E51_016149 [Hyaloscypha variabilis]